MAVSIENVKADDLLRQRKTLYRAIKENTQAVMFFFFGVALICFVFALGYWARGDLETQKDLKQTQELINVNNIYSAQLKAEINVLKQRVKELEK